MKVGSARRSPRSVTVYERHSQTNDRCIEYGIVPAARFPRVPSACRIRKLPPRPDRKKNVLDKTGTGPLQGLHSVYLTRLRSRVAARTDISKRIVKCTCLVQIVLFLFLFYFLNITNRK